MQRFCPRFAKWVSVTIFCVGAAGAAPANDKMPLTHVAVVVFPANAAAKPLVGNAQARLEQILADNGVSVGDRDDASRIKSLWKKLEDPGYFVTADDFVKNTASYRLDGLVRVYLSADVSPAPGGFFSATAQADIRLVDEDAKVQAQVSFPMGAPGRPPSDGLTAQAALLNAMQRAVDEAARLLNLEIAEPASPRAIRFSLEGPASAPPGAAAVPREPRDLAAGYVKLAQLQTGRNSGEEVTCADRAAGGELAAVGGAIHEMARGPHGLEMHSGSRVHLVDLAQQREIAAFDTQEVGRKPRDHRGSPAVLDCLFVHSWRYLAAATGDVLSLWDTERGLELSEVLLPFGADTASLSVLRAGEGFYLKVDAGKQQATYKIVPGK